MQLSEYLAIPNNEHAREGNRTIEVNALYKKEDNLNCYLTITQARNFAENVLRLARIIEENEIENAAVQVWNTGRDNETLHFGLKEARQGERRS